MDSSATTEDSQNLSDERTSFKMPTLPGPRPKKKPNEDGQNNNEESDTSSNAISSEPNDEKPDQTEPILSAEKLKQSHTSSNFSYREPDWGGTCDGSGKYKLEVIKEGIKIDDISLSGKSMYVFGRLQSCDFQMDHPSISRYHAVLQYRPQKNVDTQTESDSNSLAGWYLYDLDSTHGTWVNKKKVQPEVFVRLRVGYVIKFGGSTRLFVMDGPGDDCDQETEMSFAEMTRMKNEAKLVQKMKEMAENEKSEKEVVAEAFRKRNEFCSWGMDDDALEEDAEGDNPFAEPTSMDESLYIEDPKKSIRCFYEREGLDAPEYEFVDDGRDFGTGSKKKCRLELPVDSPDGRPVYVEVPVDGKRKEAIVACAMEACRMLDKMGLLRKANHESRAKRKKKDWAENDYYDSDEDSFFDRTGDLEKKREKRMKMENPQKSETHESLTAKLGNVLKEMSEIETKLAEDEKMSKEAIKADEEDCDELDAFMKTVKLGGLGVRAKMNMKSRLIELKHLKAKLESLISIAKPCSIKLNPNPSKTSLGMFGKATFSKLNIPKTQATVPVEKPLKDEAEVEQEEEEEEEEEKKKKTPPEILMETDAPSSHESKSEVRIPIDEYHSPMTEEDKDSQPQSKASNHGQGQKKKNNKKSDKPANPSGSSSSKKPHQSIFAPVRDMPEPKPMECSEEEDSTWLPPEGQSGDGRTKLNDKYGY